MTPDKLNALVADYAADVRKHIHDVLVAQGVTLGSLPRETREELYRAATAFVVEKRGDPTRPLN